jgi:acetylornithine/N-succinyldiaminopimelate aminotransferase
MPDVMTLAKGLGSGVPVGACLASGVAADTFVPGKHGSTFGGGPLACRAALTTLDVMTEDGLLENAATLGVTIRETLARRSPAWPEYVRFAARGCLIGIELDRPCGDLVKQALAQKFLINVTSDNVVRLLPPLVMSRAEADELC